MTTKITPFGTEDNGSQILEFNVSIPKGANTSIAPNSTLTVTQRFAEVYNQATTGAASYRQVTKLDVVHNLQYVDCKGTPRVITNVTSTIIDTPATSATPETPETLTPEIFKVVDVLIPRGKTVVTQDLINDLPTTTSQLANCAYSVFVIQVAAPTPAPAQ